MSSDTVSCKVFRIHKYEDVYENNKYLVEKCDICNLYKITYKDYNIKCKFKPNEIPETLISRIGVLS